MMLGNLEQIKKTAVRKAYLAQRAEFVKNSHARLFSINSAISKNVLDLLNKQRPNLIATYSPLKEEADPNGFQKDLPDCSFAYPSVDGSNLSFWVPKGQLGKDPMMWRPGPFGIQEPDPQKCELVQIDDCDFILVPGVSFDRCGRRVGYGKGFYDRALGKASRIKIGICFSVQLSQEPLPYGDGDVKMDWIVTENSMQECVD
ncbi:MAG: 5-formyltetrahydrofolate cyclo-ligase [Bdellovibrionales bacterium]|nr:5-formyltetrahydrofolate cyclo-ligase [Bdellovibrionales bacterium]